MFFFFQAEDGIRDYKVTGVQTCALPIFLCSAAALHELPAPVLPEISSLLKYRTLLLVSDSLLSVTYRWPFSCLTPIGRDVVMQWPGPISERYSSRLSSGSAALTFHATLPFQSAISNRVPPRRSDPTKESAFVQDAQSNLIDS